MSPACILMFVSKANVRATSPERCARAPSELHEATLDGRIVPHVRVTTHRTSSRTKRCLQLAEIVPSHIECYEVPQASDRLR